MTAALTPITKAERMELAKVIRLRAKVAKDEVNVQEKRLLADFESQLAAIYPQNHPAWSEITQTANRMVAEADTQIAHICREMGIPENFRPQLSIGWYGRGENALSERRTELRRVAQTEATARAVQAKAAIDRQSAELLTELAAGGLETEQARVFLSRIPTAESLMPSLVFADMEAISIGQMPSWKRALIAQNG